MIAIIPAAGQSRRMGGKINKQFLLLKNKPVLAHTLEVFNSSSLIKEIVIVAAQEEVDYCLKEVVKKYSFNKVSQVIAGGKERQDSVYQGLLSLSFLPEWIVVHDGARPFLTEKMLEQARNGAEKTGAALVAVPVKDTIKVINSEKIVEDTPERNKLWAVQTPQTFHFALLLEAYQKAKSDGFLGTDDASLVERMGKKVLVVDGSYENIKITTPEDLLIGEAILERRQNESRSRL